jgi:hypothetical protein
MLLAAYIALSWFSFEGLSTFADDSVSYLLMAQCWSPWHTASSVQLAACANENYPPLLPLLLAISGGDQHWMTARAVMFAGWLLAGLLFWSWGRHLFGPPIAAGMALLYLTIPMSWLSMFGVLSENTYLTLTLAAFLLVERKFVSPDKGKNPHWYLVVVVTVLAAASTLTRTIGMAVPLGLLAGALICRLRGDASTASLRGMAIAGLVSLLAGVIWYALNPPGGGMAPYMADVMEIRHTALEIDKLSSLLAPQALRLVESWIGTFTIYWRLPTQPNVLVASGLGILVVVGLLRRLWLGRADAWYLTVYLGVILIWPYPGQMPRFLHGIFPLLLLQAFYLLSNWPIVFKIRREWAVAVLLLLSIAAALPTNAFLYHRARSGNVQDVNAAHAIEFYLFADRDRALRRALEQRYLLTDMHQIREQTSPSARIVWFAPHYLNLLAGRFGIGFEDWSVLKNLPDLARALAKANADYVLLTRVNPRDTRESFDGLALLPAFAPLANTVWKASDPNGKERSVLMRIDNERLAFFADTRKSDG